MATRTSRSTKKVAKRPSPRVGAARLRALERARTVTAACHRALVRADDEKRLLNQVCRIMIDEGGYALAWAGMVRYDEARTIERIASASSGKPFSTRVRISWGDNEYGRGPAGCAVRTREPQIAPDIATDARFERWRDMALERGYASAAVLPLVTEDAVIGVFGLFAAEKDSFASDELELLQQLAEDIAYGCRTLKLRELQRKAEQQLLESERRFHGTFESVPTGINHIAPDGTLLLVNPSFAQILGYAPEELVGRNIRSFQAGEHPDAQEKLLAEREDLHAGRLDRLTSEICYRRKDGSPVWTEVTIKVMRDERGRVLYDVSSVVDISERKATEAELRRSEERYRSLTQLASEWYWEQDDQYRLTVIQNHSSAAAALNEVAQLSLGKAQWELPYLNMTEAGWAAHRARLDAREPFHDLMLKRISSLGTPMWLSMSGHPVFDRDGRFIGYRGISRDVTERVRAEQLQKLEHEVAAALAAGEHAETALEAVLRIVCESDDWDCGRYFLVDGAGESMRFGRSWAIEDPAVQRFIEASRKVVVERGRGLSGRVWEGARPLWTRDIGTDGRAARNVNVVDTGIRGVFVFPITSAGKVIGLVSLGSRRPREPDQRLMQAADALGSQIGQFLHRKQAEEALRRSEERFRSLTELSSDWYWEQDAQFRFTSISGRSMSRSEAVMGKTRWEMPGVEPRSQQWADHRALLEGHLPFRDFEFSTVSASGRRMYFSVSGEPLYDAEGNFRGYRGTGKDVSERVRAEQVQNLEHAVAAALAEADDARSAIEGVIHTICEVDGWDCGRYCALDPKTGLLNYSAGWGVDAPEITAFLGDSASIALPPGMGLLGRAWESGEPSWSTSVNRSERLLLRPQALKAGFQAGLAFPVISDGRSIGVIGLSTRVQRQPDERILRAVRALGSQLGQFLHRKHAEEALQQSNERFNVAVRATSDVIWDWDLVRNTLWWNENYSKVFGYPLAEVDASINTWYDGLHPEDRDAVVQSIHRAIDSGAETWAGQYRYRRSDGDYANIFDRGQVLRSEAGVPLRMIGAMTDVTERTRAEERIQMQAQQQRLIAEFGREALASADLEAVLAQAVDLVSRTLAAECCDVLQLDAAGASLVYRAAAGRPQDWIGKRHIPLRPGSHLAYCLAASGPVVVADYLTETRFEMSALLREHDMRSGMQVPIHGASRLFGLLAVHTRELTRFTEEDINFLASIANILAVAIERKDAEDRLSRLARYDSLTGLPNRHLFQDRLVQAMAQARRSEWLMAVLFIDLDRFKLVNDTLGHAVGDRLLMEAAKRLSACVRTSDTVGRLGGDEFAAILSDLSRPGDASTVAQKIVDALGRPFHLDGHETYVSASIGITVFPHDGLDAGALIMNADAAMYRAKEQGRNNYQYFTREMNERALARVQMEAQLRHALDKEEFELEYQPRIDLGSGVICGFEALLRWRHPEKGRILPGEFIPVLEDTGLIVPVGEWAMRRACRQIVEWQARGVCVPPVAVNLSARQFQQKDLELVVRRVVAEAGVDPTLVQFEITESLLMNDPDNAARVLGGLRDLGVKLSVDDFGTGYSSLSYLKRFPIDALKIDRAFIRDIASDADDAAITLAIISLAHSLGLQVVAEGVETRAQLDFLLSNGCDEMQGFYFSPAANAAECEAMLRDQRRLDHADTGPGGDEGLERNAA